MKQPLSRIRRFVRSYGFDVIPFQANAAADIARRELATRRSPIIFDVGANAGQTIKAVLATSNSPPVIHAFEPSPTTFAVLARAFGKTPGLKLNALGVGDVPGSLELIENSHSDMSSFLRPKDAWGEIVAHTSVPMTTIDQYCAVEKLDHIDLLKIDTQGYDSRVIRGAERLLGEKRIDYLTFEVIFDEMYEGIERYDRTFGFLADHGYKLMRIMNQVIRHGLLSWAQAVFRKD